MFLIENLRLDLFKRKWRKLNKHNDTHAMAFFDEKLVTVGNQSYGELRVLTYNLDSKVQIGNYCSIGPNVVFIPSADHSMNHISTFPYKVKVLGDALEGISKGDIIVSDDVWIGYGATILSGVYIGQGAVIAAGSVVSKNVPPYAIVGGIPARIIKYRFSSEMVEELLKVDYGKLTKEQIGAHIDTLYEDLKDMSQLIWMPRKDLKTL